MEVWTHTREILLQRNIKRGNSVGRVKQRQRERTHSCRLLSALHIGSVVCVVAPCPTPIVRYGGGSLRGTGKVEE